MGFEKEARRKERGREEYAIEILPLYTQQPSSQYPHPFPSMEHTDETLRDMDTQGEQGALFLIHKGAVKQHWNSRAMLPSC
jgi:hypothetical protein